MRPGVDPRAGHPELDLARVEGLYRELLTALGEDPDREGLRDTPRRAAAAWKEFLDYDPGALGSIFTEEVVARTYVVVRRIVAWTICEHHLLPFRVEVAIGYLPAGGAILGLSKLARIVQSHAHRLQLQERLTADVAAEVSTRTGSPDVGVWTDGQHLCMIMRGIQADAARTTTATLLGRVDTDPAIHAQLATAARIGVGA